MLFFILQSYASGAEYFLLMMICTVGCLIWVENGHLSTSALCQKRTFSNMSLDKQFSRYYIPFALILTKSLLLLRARTTIYIYRLTLQNERYSMLAKVLIGYE